MTHEAVGRVLGLWLNRVVLSLVCTVVNAGTTEIYYTCKGIIKWYYLYVV